MDSEIIMTNRRLGEALRGFTYIGGKKRYLNWIYGCFPNEFSSFWDVCGGSGSVSLSLNPPVCNGKVADVFLNDYDPTIYNFFNTLKGSRGEELQRRLSRLEYSRTNWMIAHKNLAYFPSLDKVDAAVYTYLEIVNSFSSMRDSYIKKESRALENAVRKNIPKVREKLRHITVLNCDFINILKNKVDDENAFVYIDVPYRMVYRCGRQLYNMELTEYQHFEMLEILKAARFKWALSGYSAENVEDTNSLYDVLLSGFRQYREVCPVHKLCAGVKKGGKKTEVNEVLWKNYKTIDRN